MIKTLEILVKNNEQLLKQMSESLAIYDQALYYQRQEFFKTRDVMTTKSLTYNVLYNLVKNDKAFKESKVDYVAKQYAIRQMTEAWKGFREATKSYREDPSKFTGEPALPKYLYRHKKYNPLQFDKTRLSVRKCKDNQVKLPCSNYFVNLPEKIKREQIHEINVLKYYDKIKINVIYEDNDIKDNSVDLNSAIGIDVGVNNLMAITANDKSFSYVINGRPLKSMNQFYNKTIACVKSELKICNNSYNSKKLNRLYLKRTNKIKHYMHCASKQLLDLCATNQIHKIVIGHNEGWKQHTDMGSKNNLNFMYVPYNMLISMIKYKAQSYKDVEVIVTEESYTSKVDHLALETMEHHDRYLGKRVKRGLFKSSTDKALNADINGAIGMLRKGKAITDGQLMALRDRGDVVSPRLFNLNV